MSSRVLLLVDAMAVVYRAFYAIRELSTATGEPTNAVYGFIRMLRQMREWWQPTHVAIVFDGGLPEERTTLLADYKAQRPSMPDDLAAQLPLLDELLDLLGLARFRMDGQEADDVIASIARWAEPEAGSVLLASSDKDLFQLVNKTVKMAAISGKQVLMGVEEVEEKTGVPPSRIVEWLALVGDTSDNIPGVPGVGPKTAAKLLGAHVSLDALWDDLDSVASERIRNALRENRDVVERNLQMVALRTDLAESWDWDALAPGVPDAARLIPFYERLEFTSFARELREPELF